MDSHEKEKQGYHEADKIFTKPFILMCLANFFIFLGFQMTLPTIPLLVEDLGGNEQLIGFVVGIFTFSSLLLRPFAGHALETRGRRRVYILGLVIFVITVGSFGFLTSIWLLFLVRILQGVGWGFSTTASGTIITDLVPPKRRGEGMGYYGLAGNLALALGPSLGLALAGIVSFSQLFIICSILGLIAVLLSGRIQLTEPNYPQPHQERKTKRLDMFEKTALLPSLLVFFVTVTFGGIASFLPLYTIEKGIEGIHYYFFIYAIALMLSRTFAGRVYDQKGHKAVVIPGAILIIVAMLLLAWLPNSIILFTAAFIYGFGFGVMQPGLQAWAVENAPKHRKGMANATFFSAFDLGIGIGAITFGQISHFLGYNSIYLFSAVSVLLAIFVYLFFIFYRKG